MRLALEELAFRRAKIRTPNVLTGAFPKQRSFIDDPARLKALFCTRRAAKSYTGGLYLVKECLENPNTNCLFLGLTRESARSIVWKDILKVINTDFDLGIIFNEVRLTATFPNGSVLYVSGCDANEEEMNKLLGRKYRLAVLDEGSMYSIDLHNLVYGILKPATADWRGTVAILGTASNITQGLFFDVTRKDGPREPGWSVHEWTAFDNPYIARQWQEEIDEIERLRPHFKATALYRQWYLNEWVIDKDALVYKYNEELNKTLALPSQVTEWRYLLGLDLAHSPDSCAFVVACYSPQDPNFYISHAEKHLKMDFTAAAARIHQLDAIYNFDVRIVDGANKQGVAELNNRHKTHLLPAEKHGKIDFINLFNGDLQQGKIKTMPSASPVVDEWRKLVWVTENGKIVEPREEHPGIHNDCSDGALYIWRYAYNYLFKMPERRPEPGTQGSWEPEYIRRIQAEVEREKNPDELALDWDPSWNE